MQRTETISYSNLIWKAKREMAKGMRKRTAAEKQSRRKRKQKFMTIFINGKQKKVPRLPTIEGLPVEEFIARNADPIWLHQNELWELITPDDQLPTVRALGQRLET